MCYSCEPYCKFVSTNEFDFLEHIASHVRLSSRNECFLCGKQFESYDVLFKHIKETYTKIEFECVSCATYFASKFEFNVHKCEKSVDLTETYMSVSEWREMQYITEFDIEN